MPVVIGGKPESTFADPIGLLGNCHRRIENFLSVLVKVAAEAQGGRMSDNQSAAWKTALRYFREAAPKHTADEEESLFPRLRCVALPEARALLARMDALQEDHIRAGQAHNEVDRLGLLWIEKGNLSPEQAACLSAVLGQLSDSIATILPLRMAKCSLLLPPSSPPLNAKLSAAKWPCAVASIRYCDVAATPRSRSERESGWRRVPDLVCQLRRPMKLLGNSDIGQ